MVPNSSSTKRFLYLAILAIFGCTAAINVSITAISFLLGVAGFSNLVTWSMCPVPLLCRYDDPVSPVLEYFANSPSLRYLFLAWYGPLVVALITLALVVRRLRGYWRVRRIVVPPSFSGFPYGLAILGVFLDILAWLRVGSSYGRELFSNSGYSIGLGVGCLFFVFMITELSSLRGDNQLSTVEDAAPERRRPLWGVLSLGVPLIGLGGALGIFFGLGRGDGFAALAAASLGIILIAIMLGVGAIATVTAVLRKERWVPLQVAGFALNFGIGLPLTVHLLPMLFPR